MLDRRRELSRRYVLFGDRLLENADTSRKAGDSSTIARPSSSCSIEGKTWSPGCLDPYREEPPGTVPGVRRPDVLSSEIEGRALLAPFDRWFRLV